MAAQPKTLPPIKPKTVLLFESTKAAWDKAHPHATRSERDIALLRIARLLLREEQKCSRK